MSTAESLLVVRHVEVTYNHSIVALHDVDLMVRSGTIHALLGSNGAGKTTTLRAVSNLLPAQRGRISAGEIQFAGHDVLRTNPADLVRRGLVQVLEGRHCFPTLSVEENLITGGLGRGSSRPEIADDLARVYELFPRLRARRTTAAGLTSGGEQQMTAIGRALLSRPRLLVLDEPSMGLAPLIVHDIFRALQTLNRASGLAILMAEQNSAIALRYADSATVLQNGRTVLDGPAADLRQRADIKALYLGRKTSQTGNAISPVAAA